MSTLDSPAGVAVSSQGGGLGIQGTWSAPWSLLPLESYMQLGLCSRWDRISPAGYHRQSQIDKQCETEERNSQNAGKLAFLMVSKGTSIEER